MLKNNDLCDINNVKSILSRHGFNFSKSLGQNFIIDSNICPEMASELNCNDETGVIEIGPGIGVLTKELCKVAKKVVTIELDKNLLPILDETLNDYDNLEIINDDVMKIDLNKLIEDKFSDCKSVKLCANLPYYITSPIIMMLLENKIKVDDIVVMVQKEAGERLCAEVGTREGGAVTVAVKYYAESEILFNVSRECYVPAPKVDSVVIRITPLKEKNFEIEDEKKFFRVVKCLYSQRRKTAVNSLANTLGINKDLVFKAFEKIGLDKNIRAEKITFEELIEISKTI